MRVVLPASGCEIIAKVRRRAISFVRSSLKEKRYRYFGNEQCQWWVDEMERVGNVRSEVSVCQSGVAFAPKFR